MHSLPSHLLDRALEQTRSALELESNSSLALEEASVLLKYLCLAMLGDQKKKEWRRHLTCQPEQNTALEYHLATFLETLTQALQSTTVPFLVEATDIGQTLATSQLYRQRILDLTIEAVRSERLAPETCIAPHAAPDLGNTLPGRCNHLVVFAAAPLFTHEFYPLVTDAFVRDSEHYGRAHFNLLAAHCDWLTPDGMAQRVLYMDWGENYFREIQLGVPLTPDSVQFRCLGTAEIDLHRHWSSRFSCPQINAAGAAALADDKTATLARWQSIGLEVPARLTCVRGEHHKMIPWRQQFSAIALKPNMATEGENVAFFAATDSEDAVLRHLDTCWTQGSALAQERRDGVLFRDPQDGTLHTVAVRLNAAFDGRRHLVESAYVQVGSDAQTPAARGRGGNIRDLSHVLPHLVRRQNGESVSVDTDVLATIRCQGEKAASVFSGLLLVGLDLVLDIDTNGTLQPVFLEANSRPAGLSRARYLDSSLQGVSAKLWDGLERQLDCGAVSHAA